MAQIVILLVAPQRLHFGAASRAGLRKLRASRTCVFNVFDTVEQLVITKNVRYPGQSRFCAAKVGPTSLLRTIFMVYRSGGLVVHATAAGAHLLIAAIFFHLVRRLSRSSEATRRKLRRQTNSSVKGKTMLNSPCGWATTTRRDERQNLCCSAFIANSPANNLYSDGHFHSWLSDRLGLIGDKEDDMGTRGEKINTGRRLLF